MDEFLKEEFRRYEQGLAEARTKGDKQDEVKNLYELGWLYCWRTEDGVDRAIEYHQQAIAMAREIGDQYQQARNLAALGECYGFSWQDKGDYERAKGYFEQAAAIARALGDRSYEGIFLSSIGYMWHQQRDYQRALDHYERALAIAREFAGKAAEARNLYDIGIAHRNLKAFDRAVDSVQQSIAILQTMEQAEQIQAVRHISKLADIYYEMGDYPKAVHFYEQGLALTNTLELRETQKNSLLSTFAQLKRHMPNAFQGRDDK